MVVCGVLAGAGVRAGTQCIYVRQGRDGDLLSAMWARQLSNWVGFRVLSFRMYGRHGAIVARTAEVFASHNESAWAIRYCSDNPWRIHDGTLSGNRQTLAF